MPATYACSPGRPERRDARQRTDPARQPLRRNMKISCLPVVGVGGVAVRGALRDAHLRARRRPRLPLVLPQPPPPARLRGDSEEVGMIGVARTPGVQGPHPSS